MYESEEDLVSDLRHHVTLLWGDDAKSNVEVRCHDRARMDLLVSTPNALIAVEAKLTRWGRALVQAFLHRYCADYVYIALPSEKIREHIVSEAHRFDIGVIAVGNGSTRIVQAAGPARPVSRIRHRILEAIADDGSR